MQALGIDEVVVLPCNKEKLSLSPEEFITSILKHTLHATALFCGYNYTFGKGASGNTELLKTLCKKNEINVFVMPRMTDFGVTVSSSAIRKALSEGNISLANSLLTRPFEIRGVVAQGKKLGRELNFPTANIYPDSNFPALPHGVYATKTLIDNTEYISVTNIGTNPTVNDKNIRIETFITNFERNIYECPIAVKFFEFLRPEQKFDSVDLLKKQIEKDKETAVSYFKKLH